MRCAAIVFLAVGSLFAVPASAEPGLDQILAEIRRGEAEREAALRETVYMAEARVVEWRDSTRRAAKRETLSVRRVYTRAPDLFHEEYLSMTIDGRRLSEAEIERELAKQRRGGRSRGGQGRFESPFRAEAADLYEFRLLGETTLEGRPALAIGFAPREPDASRFEGTLLVSAADYQPLHVQMTPSMLPGMLEEFAMSIRFAEIGGYRLPAYLFMEMRIRVNILVTLADRTLSIEDHYSDYRLNPGLPDELFAQTGRSRDSGGSRR